MGDKQDTATQSTGADSTAGSGGVSTTWGPKLFVAVLLGALVFFWWLLIYSGGVTIQH